MGHHKRSKKWAKKLAKRRQQERRRIERRAALVLDALRAPEDGPFAGVDLGAEFLVDALDIWPEDAIAIRSDWEAVGRDLAGQLELRMLANLDLSGHAGGRSK